MPDVQAEVCRQVYQRFGLLRGIRPTVRAAGPNRVFTFQSRGAAGGIPRISQIVRVTVDPDGRILKWVTSR